MQRPALIPELYVSNLAASKAFYVGVLGFEIEYERPEENFAFLRRAGACLMLEQAPSLEAATPEEIAGGEWRMAELRHPFGRGLGR